MRVTLSIALVFAVICKLMLPLIPLFDHGPILQVTAQPGFISIDCGGFSGNYTDAETGLSWITDSNGFGLENVSSAATVSFQTQYSWLSSMRTFGTHDRKYCYEFGKSDGIMPSNPYLVRASFWTGDTLPFSTPNKLEIHFLLLINADEWDSIDISLPQKSPLVMEVYVVAVLPTISVCVAGRDAFISALELRPINKSFTSVQKFTQTQKNNATNAMFLYARLDFGAQIPLKDVRYPDDKYDRIWSSDIQKAHRSPPVLVSQSTARNFSTDYDPELPPSAVLQTALVYNSSFDIFFDDFTKDYDFYYTLFLAEVSDNFTASKRLFNEETFNATGAIGSASNFDLSTHSNNNVAYRSNDSVTVYQDGGFLTFSFERNSTSSLGPLVNALELLYIRPMSLGTDDSDVRTLEFIKRSFPGFDSWRGDPCLPHSWSYDWLECNSEIRPRIIKLSLQNRNITAEIPAKIGSLKALVEINLQGNNLTGSIPQSIADLPNLMTLFLQDNNLSGPIPQALLDKKVDLRLAGNPILCKDNNAIYCDQQPVQTKTNERSKKSYVVIVATLVAVCAVVLILLASIFIFRSRREHKTVGAVDITNTEVMKYSNLVERFTFQQIERMTNDFRNKLGAGGFGNVFYGMLSTGLNVAVKVSSHEGGGLEFLNEVALLSRVHHKNLVELVGYCHQPRLVLIYEYMAKGSLENYLHGKDSVPLSWRDRLKIVVGAAQGLEYLHKGCKPPIIHRDVKCSNILLDEKLEGKISDFGISRSQLGDSHTSVTNVQGTFGYIAPENAELRITEKIDVFAFGVVLLEVVTGRRPLERSGHIIDWVKALVSEGQIQDIVDPSIEADCNVSSVWKVLEVAIACVEDDAQKRPDMHEVSSELNFALSFELQNESFVSAYEVSDLPFDTSNVLAR